MKICNAKQVGNKSISEMTMLLVSKVTNNPRKVMSEMMMGLPLAGTRKRVYFTKNEISTKKIKKINFAKYYFSFSQDGSPKTTIKCDKITNKVSFT
jgi:hypothetical protein